MTIEPAGDNLLDKWHDYAAKHGGAKNAIDGLPEAEREVLFEITNSVKMTPFVFASDHEKAYKALANRLQSHQPKKLDDESVKTIQTAIFGNKEFVQSALKDRIDQAKAYLLKFKTERSSWGSIHISQNTLLLLLDSFLQRADLFPSHISAPYKEAILSSPLYHKLKSPEPQDIFALIPEFESLIAKLDHLL